MRAVFVNSQALLRDSHQLAEESTEAPRLVPATLEAMRQLASAETMIIVYGCHPGEEALPASLQALITQIQSAAGRVDIAAVCTHSDAPSCRCWNESPGIIWAAATQFGLDLPSSYLVGDTVEDILTAKAAGVRPILVLGERSIEEVLGSVDLQKDFGFAPDLSRAAEFIAVEQDTALALGRPRSEAPEIPIEYGLGVINGALPQLTAISETARQSQQRHSGARVQLGDITRWLVFLTVGGLGLSLGIAYLLTHLYRVQAFPSYMYYLTLQFIDRRVRGAIFMAFGLLFIYLAVHSVVRSTGRAAGRARKKPPTH